MAGFRGGVLRVKSTQSPNLLCRFNILERGFRSWPVRGLFGISDASVARGSKTIQQSWVQAGKGFHCSLKGAAGWHDTFH